MRLLKQLEHEPQCLAAPREVCCNISTAALIVQEKGFDDDKV